MKNREGTTRKFYIVNMSVAAKSALSYSVGLYNILKDKKKEKKEKELEQIVKEPFSDIDISTLKEELMKRLVDSKQPEDEQTAKLIEELSTSSSSSSLAKGLKPSIVEMGESPLHVQLQYGYEHNP